MAKLKVDGKEIEVPDHYTLLQAAEEAGAEVPRFLLPRAAVDRRQLPHVPDRGEGRAAQARRILRHGRARPAPRPEWRNAGNLHQHADGQEGPRRRDGIPADQPSARLPDLRPGRRMRPAGPGDGLRRRFLALPGKQARGRRQIYRPAGQDDHEPLHPLHAVRPLHHRGRRHFGARPDRARRGCRDHDLSRKRDDLGVAGQRHRPLPGRRADLEALCLPGAAVGTDQDRVHRRDGRRRLGDPRRLPRPRGDAHHAARQRSGERGVDFGQDPLHLGRAALAAARPALCPQGIAAGAGGLVRRIRGDQESRLQGQAGQNRRDRRRSGDGRGDVCAEASDAVARLGEYRLPAGRFGARPGARPRQLHLQPDDRRHRAGRRGADHRRQSALRGFGAERAHPQALEAGQPAGRRDRRGRRPALRLRAAWRGAGIAEGAGRRQWQLLRDAEGGQRIR